MKSLINTIFGTAVLRTNAFPSELKMKTNQQSHEFGKISEVTLKVKRFVDGKTYNCSTNCRR